MGCGVSRCYSTLPVTVTMTTAITSTASGTVATVTITSVTVETPSIPTGFGTLDGRTNEEDTSQTAGASPTSVPKYMPPLADTDGGDSQDSGLSTTQLGGIIGGAAAFLVLVIAAAWILIRHIDKLGGQLSRKPSSSDTRYRIKPESVSDTDSSSSWVGSVNESLRRSRTRRKARSTARRHRQRRNGLDAATGDSLLNERARRRQDYLDNLELGTLTRTPNHHRDMTPSPEQIDLVSPTPLNDASPMLLRSPSPVSEELEASCLAQELAGSSSASSMADQFIHYPQEIPPSDLPMVATRPPLAYQWMRSIGLLRQSENASPEHINIDDEEWHGFYGSRDHMAGRTGLGITYPEIPGGRLGHGNGAGRRLSNRHLFYR